MYNQSKFNEGSPSAAAAAAAAAKERKTNNIDLAFPCLPLETFNKDRTWTIHWGSAQQCNGGLQSRSRDRQISPERSEFLSRPLLFGGGRILVS